MISSMLQYIQKSPDCFHAVENLRQRLLSEGYTQLTAGEWTLTPGGKYFVTKNGSSLMAFRVPQGRPTGFVLTASHSDSPCFRLRDHTELAGEFVRLSAERYGGMINDSWLDRPLSVAGRVLVRREGGLEARLVDLKRDVALIPRVAIHLNRDGNNGTKYNPAQDLVALYAGGEQKGSFDREIAAAAGCQPEDIVARDLFLYNNQPGTVWGPAGEFLSAPRLDDLACVFACTQGFLTAHETTALPVLCVFDNEEIGSETKQGAMSTFLADALRRINGSLGFDDESYHRALAASMLVSCDNAHAVHPNHAEKCDARNQVVLNGGIVIKEAANQHYCTDAFSRAVFQAICDDADVPTQAFANKSDMAGGSTLGNLSNMQASMHAVDVGLPQLAMHSSYETGGVRDVMHAIRALTAFYERNLTINGSESVEL